MRLFIKKVMSPMNYWRPNEPVYVLMIYNNYNDKYYPITAYWEYPRTKDFFLDYRWLTFEQIIGKRGIDSEFVGGDTIRMERYFPIEKLA